ncbi:MAG: ferredoxin [Candidatus Buchananbacteria bacterium]
MAKPIVDQNLCIGCGSCESICPAVFKLNDGKAQVIDGADYEANAAAIQDAISSCPVNAIVTGA